MSKYDEPQPEVIRKELVQGVPTTLNELLDQEIIEPDGLSIGKAPLLVQKIKLEKGHHLYTAYVDYPLDHLRFYKFLKWVAPVQNMSGAAIVADWEMPNGQNRIDKNLQKLHAALGDSMQEFERHRLLFIDTLSKDPLRILMSEYNNLTYFDHRENLDLWIQNGAFIDTVSADHIKTHRVGKVEDPHLAAYRSFIGAGDEITRGKLFQQFFQNLPPNERRGILYGLNSSFTPVFPDDTPGEVIARKYNGTVIKISKDGSIEITYSDLGKCVVTEDGDEWKPEYYNSNFLLPSIQWQLDANGNRIFDFSFPTERSPNDMSNDLVSKYSQAGLQFNLKRLNPLVGMLITGYVEPTVTSHWPTQVGLPGSNIKQDMGPAQVPVLALMRQRELSRTRLLQRIEEHVDLA